MKMSNIPMTLALVGVISLAAMSVAFAESEATHKFVKTVPVANAFEIQSSKLALKKSQNSNVRSFAQEMVDDHAQAGSDFKKALSDSKADSSEAKDTLDPKHQAIMDSLNNASGKDFDTQYIKAQTDAHNDAVSLFSDYAKNGDDASLKDFAGKTLPTLEKHLSHVKQLKSAS